MAQLAVDNEWEGIVCYGSVREIDALEELDIGICAVGTIPVLADDEQTGDIDLAVNFAGGYVFTRRSSVCRQHGYYSVS